VPILRYGVFEVLKHENSKKTRGRYETQWGKKKKLDEVTMVCTGKRGEGLKLGRVKETQH